MEKQNNELRNVSIERNYLKHPEGSALITVGNTKVICTATVEEYVPPFLKDEGKGWLTAEYALLPRSTDSRVRRSRSGAPDGRTVEIQRLIGRALRSVFDFKKMPGITLTIDCDVIQADGGTRCASITGGFVAAYDAINWMLEKGKIQENPITEFLAAVSVGIVGGNHILDLCYKEDSNAEVDMNVIMTESGKFVEIQGTGEERPFDRAELEKLLELGNKGVSQLIKTQKEVLGV